MLGSTWNKWDLHAHSPLTHLNNTYKGMSISDYVDNISKQQLAVVGITNYFYFADNELDKIRDSIYKKSLPITVLGNLEFRLNQQNKDGEWINIHCIFAEHLTTNDINGALSKLEILNTGAYNQAIYCSKESFDQNKVQHTQVTVDLSKLLEHLNKNFRFGKDYLIAACPNGYGGFRPTPNDGRSIATAIEVEKRAQILLSKASDREFFLTNLDRYVGAVPKPVFCCSDAHGISSDPDNGRYVIGDKYTWVKAQASFEGLRQTLIEPEHRVQQDDNFIERTFVKPKFSSIQLTGPIFPNQTIEFKNQKIPLNPNMVAIIGGRGTGKSLLLDSMHTLFNSNKSGNARTVNIESLTINIDQGFNHEMEFNSEDDTYSYLHVSQGDIKKFTDEPIKLSQEIKTMLGIQSASFDSSTSDTILEILGKYRGFVQFWEQSDELGNWINTPLHQEQIIERNRRLMETITNPQNKQLIEEYQKNLKLINEKYVLIKDLKDINATIERSMAQINSALSNLNNNKGISTKLPIVVTRSTENAIEQNILSLQQDLTLHNANNANIVINFRQQGINQDISSLLDKIAEYQSAITTAELRLQEIKKREQQYQQLVADRTLLISKYKNYLEEERDTITNKFLDLKQPKDVWNEEQNDLVASILKDINIRGSIVFDVNRFYVGLESCLNMGKFRSTQQKSSHDRLKEMFNVSNIDDFFNLIKGDSIITCEGDLDPNGAQVTTTIEGLFWKSEYFNQGGRFELQNYLFAPDSIKNYLYANAEFQYKGKTVDKLSVGQRGTFYVCLKLATDPFGSPFVFDQPEDDLDNAFIMNQLVPLFKKIKKYRQVIIVTHNANLVVNTDAEQVIVAKNENEVISYTSGAIEDGNVDSEESIKANICNILEGGRYAFEKREQKYGIQFS